MKIGLLTVYRKLEVEILKGLLKCYGELIDFGNNCSSVLRLGVSDPLLLTSLPLKRMNCSGYKTNNM